MLINPAVSHKSSNKPVVLVVLGVLAGIVDPCTPYSRIRSVAFIALHLESGPNRRCERLPSPNWQQMGMKNIIPAHAEECRNRVSDDSEHSDHYMRVIYSLSLMGMD